MNVVTTEDFGLIPEGSFIRDVVLKVDTYTGLWCSRNGSYTVSVPASLCKSPQLDNHDERLKQELQKLVAAEKLEP